MGKKIKMEIPPATGEGEEGEATGEKSTDGGATPPPPREPTAEEIAAYLAKKEADEKAKSKDENEQAKGKEKEKETTVPPVTPAQTDENMAFMLAMFQKQMIESLDITTIKRFIVECDGMTLKEKAIWVEKNKPAPSPDPDKALGKGPPGGAAITPYDPSYKHEYPKNPKYIG